MDAISGLKSSPWAGLGKLVNTHLNSSIFAGRYHNLQSWFPDSIYIAVITTLKNRKAGPFLTHHTIWLIVLFLLT
jgi:hypothetical protein